MSLEMRSMLNHSQSQITATQLNPKNTRSSEEKHEKAIENSRSGSKIPDLAPLAKSFRKYQNVTPLR